MQEKYNKGQVRCCWTEHVEDALFLALVFNFPDKWAPDVILFARTCHPPDE